MKRVKKDGFRALKSRWVGHRMSIGYPCFFAIDPSVLFIPQENAGDGGASPSSCMNWHKPRALN